MENKLVLVDTNCLIRIYFSSLRPILNRPVLGYELRTLQSLANELKHIANRRDEYAWLSAKNIQDDVDFAIVTPTRGQVAAIEQDAADIIKIGNATLQNYCTERAIDLRRLSMADARILSAALELNAAMATDEWPLRHVSSLYDYDNGAPVELFSSVDLIFFLEQEKLLTPEDRKRVYADWLKFGEKLLKGSDEIYRQRFGDYPPNGQY